MRPHTFLDHPDRQAVGDEIHARPVEFVACPSRVRRVALVLPSAPDAVLAAHRRFASWCATNGVPVPAAASRQHSFDAAGRHVSWELHTEFVSLTWASRPDDTENWPAGIGLESFGPERLLAAARIDVFAGSSVPDGILADFQPASLCNSRIGDGQAEVATDFITDPDGFTRLELANGSSTPLQRAILVRRLLEIESYRGLALLGLPLARAVTPELNAVEASLSELVTGLANADTTPEAQAALAALNALSVRAGELTSRTSYRFAASRAYGELLLGRLDGLGEEGISGSTLTRYVRNRVDPALATCRAVERRQVANAENIERATELLNTRISLDIQVQNKSVLDTIAETSRSQFQLQKTVEGLSTIAISYYLLGIIGYVLTAVSDIAHLPKNLLVAGAAPLVLLSVWLLVRSIRK